MTEKNLCSNCLHKRRMIGDAHIRCANPPATVMNIGSGGDERYDMARKWAEEMKAVVRCVWPGSGFWPGNELIGFDSNTVFGCCNFARKVKP